MDFGQKMFHDFYMKLVQDDRVQEAEELLKEGFQKQKDGSFGEFIETAKDKYFDLIKPEHVDQLKEAMSKFLGDK